MRAALCKTFGGPELIEVTEVPDPVPGPGEALVKIEAAALNYFDTLIIRNKYQFKPALPFAPAAEVAGRIERVGPGVEGLGVDDRVMGYLGWGGAAEKVVARAENLARLPDSVSAEVGAGLSVTYGTAMHGLIDRGRLKAGETLVVLGASGGAGLAAVEIGARLGARVIACASSAVKLEVARAHGAAETVDYTTADLKTVLKDLGGSKGIDVVYDCVGGPYAEPAVRALGWDGRFLVIGFAAGDIPKLPLNLLLLKSASAIGVFWGAYLKQVPGGHAAHMRQVLDWVAAGEIEPAIHGVYPLERIAEAMAAIERREAIGKVILKP
ncbi:MAG: NADPH:quinone oxidoreductase family protein [Hyphomicrobiaceae bacterium]